MLAWPLLRHCLVHFRAQDLYLCLRACAHVQACVQVLQCMCVWMVDGCMRSLHDVESEEEEADDDEDREVHVLSMDAIEHR